MTQEQFTTPFDWFANQFTSVRREEFIGTIYPHLKGCLKPGSRAADLCCGAGSITIFLEEQGVEIVGFDQAPYLIKLARQEAANRGAKANFIQADILSYPMGKGIYDLMVCFGNAITDFPHQDFPQFRDRVFDALRPGGYFILEYIDGLERVTWMSDPKEVIEQGVDSEIIRRFIEYDPSNASYKMEFHHLGTGETYLCTEYVYITPMIHWLLELKFKLLRSVRLEQSFLDIYLKP